MQYFKAFVIGALSAMAAITAGAALAALLITIPAHAQTTENEFVEGGHYELLAEAQPVQTGDQIEVVEMFWYKCPHCYELEPYIEQWLANKPENAEFVPIPAVLGKGWMFSARAYYALEALGLDEVLHAEVYKAIHEQRKSLDTVEQFVDWAATHPKAEGLVDRDLLTAAFNSFAVENKINFATLMAQNYRINGVPSIIVDGKYRTSVTLAGSPERLLEVINHLVALSAEERG